MNAIDLLTHDHDEVRALFEKFETAHEAEDTEEMSTVASSIFEELEVHTTIEEEIFYPAARGKDEEIDETLDESLQEHHVVDVLMEEMGGIESGSDEWIAKMTVLIENVEHHADEEESELFPSVRSHMAADDLDQLGADLEANKVELGAPTADANADLTVDELHTKATEQEIPGRSDMDREELEATVSPE
jgi:hemerythrin-like domain-containing protein